MHLTPDHPIKCLLVHPRFAAFSFWNYTSAAETIGAKTPSPPLGLLTVAALLPSHWEFRLLDLNTRSFSDADWDWADLVCVGGMLPQQRGILDIIAKAKAASKLVAVGGSDPSSQPSIYSHADVLVVGEGESGVPRWLECWRQGEPRGIFKETEKPDITQSPTPRFDLIKLADYVQIGIQYSRGCPFNCEFCDIIELFGRKPRTKTPAQMLKELSVLKDLGYSGAIDIVDDNFIGNKRNVKRHLLPALKEWNQENGHPFFYCTEASMNLADDTALLEGMRDADFRVIFMGIETPDPDLLLKTQKSQNTVHPIIDRVRALYRHGMVVTAGFILGFDGERPGIGQAMTDLIEEADINMAMVGLLVALPNTQLTRRLLKERRLLSFKGELIESEEQLHGSAVAEGSMLDVVDQTVAGLNFITDRERLAILEDYRKVVRTIYDPKRYFDRVLRVGLRLQCRSRHRPRLFELRRHALGFWRTSLALTKNPATRWLYLRNALRLILRGHVVFEQTMRLMGIYLHFYQQTSFLLATLDSQMPRQKRVAERFPSPKANAPSSTGQNDTREDKEPRAV